MTPPRKLSRAEVRLTFNADRAAIALTEALKRLWNAVKERLVGPTPVPVRVPVRPKR